MNMEYRKEGRLEFTGSLKNSGKFGFGFLYMFHARREMLDNTMQLLIFQRLSRWMGWKIDTERKKEEA